MSFTPGPLDKVYTLSNGDQLTTVWDAEFSTLWFSVKKVGETAWRGYYNAMIYESLINNAGGVQAFVRKVATEVNVELGKLYPGVETPPPANLEEQVIAALRALQFNPATGRYVVP